MAYHRDISQSVVGFQQQGTVDWTSVAGGSVTFSIDVLSRLSKAGVEAFTLVAAQTIFSNAKLGRQGEVRMNKAIDGLSAFPSFGKVLWFGFGIKHVVRSMQDSAEGLACVAVCASLTEHYSTSVAGQILQELFLLLNPPIEYTTALRQWISLVETSEGLLASTEFGLVLHGIARLFLRDDLPSRLIAGSPQAIAIVLKQIFEISRGGLDRLHLSGGADCAWIAAVAHWIFDLRVELRDQTGDVIYRPDGTRNDSSTDSQVIITYSEQNEPGSIQVTRKHYVIPGGRLLFSDEMEHKYTTCGRVLWETCLVDTFGNPMRLLLGEQARTFGNCLGSAARIFLGSMRDEDYETDSTYQSKDREMLPPVSTSSYGRGFCLQALRLLPELDHDPALRLAMEAAMDQSYENAIEKYLHSITQLSQLCQCNRCSSDSTTAQGNSYCLMVLAQTVCIFVRSMSAIQTPGELVVWPSRRGMEMLYEKQAKAVPSESCETQVLTEDHIIAISWPKTGILQLSHIIFTGRENSSVDRYQAYAGNPHTAAIFHYGLCFFLDTLIKTTSNPEEACRVTVIPGRIEWNGLVFDSIRDPGPIGGMERIEEMPWYSSSPLTDITVYDDLTDSSSPDLRAELIVVEAAIEPRSLRVAYRISTPKHPGHHFTIGPAKIWTQLNRAYTASSCHGKVCKSLNVFRAYLVPGEGPLIDLPVLDKPSPILRVLSSQDLAIWVAVSAETAPLAAPVDGAQWQVALRYRLQMGQCVRCCVIGSENYRTAEDMLTLTKVRTVCLIMSP
ncbi:hypothetical protein NW752_012077 [Fusarium irregulare]|uniref:Uncharacterized protein n=1 Tax=Fusarium irregulare TaxID=2494466 RepID=A0A9W8U6W4_9HYPO|nr:hypothetical protein NW752_012077 [Fusarium irregulare]KAJ4006585.1 hypothetical protein NW766_010681 [Fusarium irregulare]